VARRSTATVKLKKRRREKLQLLKRHKGGTLWWVVGVFGGGVGCGGVGVGLVGGWVGQGQ